MEIQVLGPSVHILTIPTTKYHKGKWNPPQIPVNAYLSILGQVWTSYLNCNY
jgi:hypothetical protein